MVYLDEKAIQQLINALNERNFEPGSMLFADEVIIHYPGVNRIAGDHQGKPGVLDFLNKQIELVGGSFKRDTFRPAGGRKSSIDYERNC